MELNISDMIFAAINFLVMAGALTLLLYKPVIRILDARKLQLEQLDAEAERKLTEARAFLEDGEQKLNMAQRQAEAILDKAAVDARDSSEAIISEAKEKTRSLYRGTQADIELEKRKAEAELRGEAARLAVELARRLLTTGVTVSSSNRVEEFAEHISSPEVQSAIMDKMASSCGPVNIELVTSRPLSDGERALVNKVLTSAKAGDAMLMETTSDELIGGCVLFVGDLMIDCSVAQMLQRLETELVTK